MMLWWPDIEDLFIKNKSLKYYEIFYSKKVNKL